MTNQPPESTMSIEQIQAAFAQSFGYSIGQLTFQKLNLEMQNQALQNRVGDLETRMLEAEQDRGRMIKAKIVFEDEAFDLKAENGILADRVRELELELDVLKTAERETVNPHAMSDEAAAIAGEVADIIASAKEKAAPD